MLRLTDATFDAEVLRANRPVLVILTAPWSAVSALSIEMAADLQPNFGDLVKLAILDVEENPGTASVFARDTLPGFLVFRQGRVIRSAGPSFDRNSLIGLFELALASQG